MIKLLSINRYLNESNDTEDTNNSVDIELDIDTQILDELVELVGSEESVEEAAEMAYSDLMEAAESGEVEMTEEDIPEKLSIAALVIKLVELGHLDIDSAEEFISNNLG